MGVLDGQPVSAAITNPAFINKNVNDIMPNKLGFSRPMSGSSIADIQQAVNNLYTATGVSESQTGTNYNATPNTINNGDPYLVALTKLADKFDPATGHQHTGTAGDAPMIALLEGISSGTAPSGYLAASNGAGGMTFVNPATGVVNSIAVSGDAPLSGAVLFVAGSNMNLEQNGQEIVFQTNAGTGGVFSQQSVTGSVVENPPAAAFGFILMALDSNSQDTNWCIGATASSASGMQLQPGRDTGFIPCAAPVSICPVGGTQTYALQWLTQ